MSACYSYDLHSQLKRNYSGSCGPGVRRSCRSKQKLCLSSHSARCFGFCLSGSTSLKNFSFVPFGRGVHAPGLGSQGRERAFNMHAFPPNTHTCLILVLMMVYSKCSTVSTTWLGDCGAISKEERLGDIGAIAPRAASAFHYAALWSEVCMVWLRLGLAERKRQC